MNFSLLLIMITNEKRLRKQIRYWVLFFITFLILSGITAFAVETELAWLSKNHSFLPISIRVWLDKVYLAVQKTNKVYPFLAYGTDWLGFAHLVIAVVFFGLLTHPVRNIWCIEFGMIACLMVIPFALIAGSIRHIPFIWRIIDCSFGVIGFVPLYVCYRKIKMLERLVTHHSSRRHRHADEDIAA